MCQIWIKIIIAVIGIRERVVIFFKVEYVYFVFNYENKNITSLVKNF